MNQQSLEALNAGNRAEQRTAVLELIKLRGGLSMKEVSRLLNVEFNTVSGRGTELKKAGAVTPTGEVREGSAVLKAVEANEVS